MFLTRPAVEVSINTVRDVMRLRGDVVEVSKRCHVGVVKNEFPNVQFKLNTYFVPLLYHRRGGPLECDL